MKCPKCSTDMEETSLIQFTCPHCGYIESYRVKEEKPREEKEPEKAIYKVLGDGIIMLCSTSALILTISGTILGFVFEGTRYIPGLSWFFSALILFVVSFGAGLLAYFTLVSVIHERKDVYERALSIPVAIQQVTLVVGLILLILFIYEATRVVN